MNTIRQYILEHGFPYMSEAEQIQAVEEGAKRAAISKK